MRCYVCNAYLPDPEFDNNHKTLPCPDCNDSVNDALADFETEEFEDGDGHDSDQFGEELDEEELP